MKKLLQKILPMIAIAPILVLPFISADINNTNTTNMIFPDLDEPFTDNNRFIKYKNKKYLTKTRGGRRKIYIKSGGYLIPVNPNINNFAFFAINNVQYLYRKNKTSLMNIDINIRAEKTLKNLKVWTLPQQQYITNLSRSTKQMNFFNRY